MTFKKGDPKPASSGRKSNEMLRTAQDLARPYTKEAIERLAQIMRDPDIRAAAAACAHLINRAWGLPAQTITGAIEHQHTIGPDTNALAGKLQSALDGRSGAEDTQPTIQ